MGFSKSKKNMDVEVDLISFISLLSVCICFLLLTSVWVHIGSMNFKQSFGGGAAAMGDLPPQLWVDIKKEGNIVFRLENVKGKKVSRKLRRMKIAASEDGKIRIEEVREYAKGLVALVPELNTALLQPNGETAYEELVALMDTFRSEGFSDLGVTPL